MQKGHLTFLLMSWPGVHLYIVAYDKQKLLVFHHQISSLYATVQTTSYNSISVTFKCNNPPAVLAPAHQSGECVRLHLESSTLISCFKSRSERISVFERCSPNRKRCSATCLNNHTQLGLHSQPNKEKKKLCKCTPWLTPGH